MKENEIHKENEINKENENSEFNKNENNNFDNINIIINSNENMNNQENNNNKDINDYSFLSDDKILGRFSLAQKICILNKLNILVFNKIKKELMMELNRKRLENKILMINSKIKTNLILHKKLYSLLQEKMIRDYNYKKKLKDFRKKLMDEKIENLKYKNIVCIMKAYGIYQEDKSYR